MKHEYTVCFYSTKSRVHICGDDTKSITNTSSLSELPLETATSRSFSIKLMKLIENSSMPTSRSNLRKNRKRNGSCLLMNALSHVVEVTIIPLNFCRRERSPIPKEIGYVISSIQKSRVLWFHHFSTWLPGSIERIQGTRMRCKHHVTLPFEILDNIVYVVLSLFDQPCFFLIWIPNFTANQIL